MDDLLKKLARRDSGFVYLARKLPRRAPTQVRKLEHRRACDLTPASRRDVPARLARVAGPRQRRIRRRGLRGPRVRAENDAARHGRRAPDRARRARPADLDQGHDPAEAGARHPADARREDPGQGRGGAARRRRGLQAQGRDRDRDGPAQPARCWRWPTGRASNANDVARRAGYADAEPRGRLHLRAGLDVQGRHGRRRAAGRASSRPTRSFNLPPQIQVADRADRRVARPRRRDAHDRADPRAVLQRRRDHDRPARGQGALRQVGPPLRLRPADRRRRCRARSAASSCRCDKYSGSSMGNLPIGQGDLGHADADGRPPTRRSPTAAILRTPQIVNASTAGAPALPRAPRDLARARPPQLRTMLEGVVRAGRHRRRRSRSPATSSPARPARRTRSTRRPASTRSRATSPRSWASRPPPTRSCSSPVMVDEPQGGDLRRHGRGARVPRHHAVRAAVPADPAASAGRVRRRP